MMNQQRSAKIHLLKFMFILPLLAVTLLAFRSEIAKAVTKISAIPSNNNKAKLTVGSGQINIIKSQKPSAKTVDVQAYFTGEVLKAKKNKDTYFLVIKHGDRYDAYTNLSTINVKEGDKITKGQVIGAVALDKTTGLPEIKFSMFNSLANIDANGNFINDTTKDKKGATLTYDTSGADNISTTTTSTAKGNLSSSSATFTTGYGTVNSADLSSSPGNSWSTSTQSGNVKGFTSTTVLPANTLGGPKGMLVGVPIYDNDELVSTIDPQHIEESQIEAIKKEFTDNGFDLKITADIKDGKAKKLSISISGSRKDNSSSSVYSADDITDKDKIIIKITANKKTGSVSIDSSAEDDDTK